MSFFYTKQTFPTGFQCPLLGVKQTSGGGRFSFICASASRGRADERASDPLHGGRIDAKASGCGLSC